MPSPSGGRTRRSSGSRHRRPPGRRRASMSPPPTRRSTRPSTASAGLSGGPTSGAVDVPPFGKLPVDDFLKIQLLHGAHHLSFLQPRVDGRPSLTPPRRSGTPSSARRSARGRRIALGNAGWFTAIGVALGLEAERGLLDVRHAAATGGRCRRGSCRCRTGRPARWWPRSASGRWSARSSPRRT